MRIEKTVVTLAIGMTLAGSAWALPFLQLDVIPGLYVDGNSVPKAAGPFDLYALVDVSSPKQQELFNQSKGFYLAAAITPKQGATPSAFGSFTINGQPYSSSANMQWGTPPVGPLDFLADDPSANGLQNHGDIYPTWMAQILFTAFAGETVPYNAQEEDKDSLTSASGMKYQSWLVDVSGLTPGFSVHFDLYSWEQKAIWDRVKQGKGKNQTWKDVLVGYDDWLEVAPFSHDAQSLTVVAPPSPNPTVPDAANTVTLLGMALLGLGALRRRFSR